MVVLEEDVERCGKVLGCEAVERRKVLLHLRYALADADRDVAWKVMLEVLGCCEVVGVGVRLAEGVLVSVEHEGCMMQEETHRIFVTLSP